MNIESLEDGDGLSGRAFLVFLIILAIIFFAMLPKWMRGDDVKAVLAKAGYTLVELHGFSYLPCGDDLFGMAFTAKGPTGVPTSGSVCKGIFSDATIRLSSK